LDCDAQVDQEAFGEFDKERFAEIRSIANSTEHRVLIAIRGRLAGVAQGAANGLEKFTQDGITGAQEVKHFHRVPCRSGSQLFRLNLTSQKARGLLHLKILPAHSISPLKMVPDSPHFTMDSSITFQGKTIDGTVTFFSIDCFATMTEVMGTDLLKDARPTTRARLLRAACLPQ
jgi:hypothetical protein